MNQPSRGRVAGFVLGRSSGCVLDVAQAVRQVRSSDRDIAIRTLQVIASLGFGQPEAVEGALPDRVRRLKVLRAHARGALEVLVNGHEPRRYGASRP